MSELPSSILHSLERAPVGCPVALLLRHSVRDPLPPGGIGNALPITELGRRLAVQLGEVIGPRLQTLRSSPLVRCTQTAECVRAGAGVERPIVPDRLLGDPGVYIVDAERAWANWETRGHAGVIEHLMSGSEALPGMALPDEAARMLVGHMLGVAGDVVGIHVFVSHDSVVVATAARLLGQKLEAEVWPAFLEGALF